MTANQDADTKTSTVIATYGVNVSSRIFGYQLFCWEISIDILTLHYYFSFRIFLTRQLTF